MKESQDYACLYIAYSMFMTVSLHLVNIKKSINVHVDVFIG